MNGSKFIPTDPATTHLLKESFELARMASSLRTDIEGHVHSDAFKNMPFIKAAWPGWLAEILAAAAEGTQGCTLEVSFPKPDSAPIRRIQSFVTEAVRGFFAESHFKVSFGGWRVARTISSLPAGENRPGTTSMLHGHIFISWKIPAA